MIEAALREAIGGSTRARLIPAETNQVNVDTPGVPAERFVEAARRRGVLVGAMGPFRTRAVTHLDVSRPPTSRRRRARGPPSGARARCSPEAAR